MKGFSLLALNVRSLYTKLDELYIRFNEFDILCFSETWANSSYTDEMLSLHRRDRGSAGSNRNVKRGGGLIIYIKKELSKFVTVFDQGCKISPNLEQLFILIDKPNVRKCAIGVVYRPPSGKISDGLSKLSETIRLLQLCFQGEMAIVGDFNINYNLRHSNSFELIKELEREFNLDQIIKSSTRITNKTSNCIDLIFSNVEYIQSCGTIDVAISDHIPTFFIKKKDKLKKTYATFQGRSYVRYAKGPF